MTVAEVRKGIKWGNTIHNACREFTCPDGYKIAICRQDEFPDKDKMDKYLIQEVQEHLGEPLTI